MNLPVNDRPGSAVQCESLVHFGGFVSCKRELVDLPDGSLVEVDLPHYKRVGLGRALLRVVRYYFSDINRYGVVGISIVADTSCLHVVYEDMHPMNHGQSQSAIQARAPLELVKELYSIGFAPELVTLGAIRYREHESRDSLIRFIETYHKQASWFESHPVDVIFSNIETRFDANAGAFETYMS